MQRDFTDPLNRNIQSRVRYVSTANDFKGLLNMAYFLKHALQVVLPAAFLRRGKGSFRLSPLFTLSLR